MKIHHSTQNNFKGKYIVKGTGREITKVMSEICSRSSDPITQNIIQHTTKVFKIDNKIKPLKNFICIAEPLTKFFSPKQPLVEVLFVTNDDIEIISEYYKNKFGILTEDKMDEVHLTIFKNRVDKFFKKNTEEFIEYNNAQQKCLENGDASSLSNFIVKQAVQAKKKLLEILSLDNTKEEDLPRLRASNVLNAIQNNSFDFINGKIVYNKNSDLD